MSEPTINESIRTAAYIGNKDAFLETGYQASIPINDNSKINVFGGLGTGFKDGADLNLVGYGQYSLNFGNIGAETRLKAIVGNDNKTKVQLRVSPFNANFPVSDSVSIYGNLNGTIMYNQSSEKKFSVQPRAFVGATYKHGKDLRLSAEINGYNLHDFKGINDLELGIMATYNFNAP